MGSDLDIRFQHFRDGCELAPDDRFINEKRMRFEIGEAVDKLRARGRTFGLTPCNSDGAHHVEAVIYAWLTKGTTFGASAEGLSKYPPGAEDAATLARIEKLKRLDVT